jgi:hypothetical protein
MSDRLLRVAQALLLLALGVTGAVAWGWLFRTIRFDFPF